MKRSELVFVTAVCTALLTGFLMERSRTDEPFLSPVAAGRRPTFEPLEPPEGKLRLAGSVVTPGGEPAAGVSVHLLPAETDAGDERPLYWDHTDAEGRFSLERVAVGDYEAILLAPGHPNGSFPVSVPQADPAGELRWTLPEALPPVPALPVMRRTLLEGRLHPPVGLTAERYPVAGYEVVLRPSESGHPLSGAVLRRVTVDDEGLFAVDDLVLARYRVEVLPPWARGGSWPVLDELEFEHGEDLASPLSLWLRLRCGELAGTARDQAGRPIAGALVVAWPAGTPEHPWPPENTDAEGGFLVRDLPPGDYHVEVHAGAALRAETVTVGIGSRTELGLPPLDPRGER